METTQSNPGTLVQQIAEQLRSDILESGHPEGHRFTTELEVAKRFSVSRYVAREAVGRLRALGIVGDEGWSGIAVGKPDVVQLFSNSLPFYVRNANDMLRVARLRYVLEIGVVDLAVANATEEQITRLEKLAEAFEHASKAGDSRESLDQLDIAFHGVFLEMSGDELIAGMHRVIQSFFSAAPRYCPDSYYPNSPSDHQSTSWQHAEISASIRARDPEQTRALIRMHLKTLLDPKEISGY